MKPKSSWSHALVLVISLAALFATAEARVKVCNQTGGNLHVSSVFIGGMDYLTGQWQAHGFYAPSQGQCTTFRMGIGASKGEGYIRLVLNGKEMEYPDGTRQHLDRVNIVVETVSESLCVPSSPYSIKGRRQIFDGQCASGYSRKPFQLRFEKSSKSTLTITVTSSSIRLNGEYIP